MDEQQPKISTPEAILILMITVIADLISIIPVINWLVSVVMFPVTQFYLRMKGIKGTYMLVGNVIELIPVLSVLPGYTTAMAITIYVDRHPQLTAKIQKMPLVVGKTNAKIA